MGNISPTILTIIFGIIGAIGVIFGIYQYFASRRYAKIVYEVKELADFKLPEDFYQAIGMIPLSLSLDNGGNKSASNVLLHLKTRTDIVKYIVGADEKWDINQSKREITIRIPNLNPSDSFNLLVYCEKDEHPTASVLNEVRVTISEGRVIDKEALSSQQVYKEILDNIVVTMPLGIGNIFKLASSISKPRKK